MADAVPDHDGNRRTVLAGRYELTGQLGTGGMAQVHRGRDLELDRQVAVKFLPHGEQDDEDAQRLRQEARAAASLTHPGIVAIHDVGTTDAGTFVVMQYVPGETLRTILDRDGPMSWDSTARIGAEVCAALDAAHAHGVLHRDISPGNIMICADDSVKVVDFGIARTPRAQVVTQAGTVLGTPAYLSPEQARGEKLDGRCDLYSLGCCLYELVTGERPFSAPTPDAVVYQHVHEQPREPRSLDPDVPERLQAVILRAMAKDPRRRYRTATAMAAELTSCRHQDEPKTQPAPQVTGSPSAPDAAPSVKRTTRVRPLGTGDVEDADPVDDVRGTVRRRLGLVLIVVSLVVGAVAALVAAVW